MELRAVNDLPATAAIITQTTALIQTHTHTYSCTHTPKVHVFTETLTRWDQGANMYTHGLTHPASTNKHMHTLASAPPVGQ